MKLTVNRGAYAAYAMTAGIFIAIPWLAYAADAAADATLNLDQALDEAFKNSPVVQTSQAAANEAHWQRLAAMGQGFLPKVSVNLGHYFTENYQFTQIALGGSVLAFPGIYPTTQLSLSASIPIFDGLANIRQLQAAALSENAAQQEAERVKFEVAQEVRLAFYQALAATALDAVAEQNVTTLEDHLRQVDIQRRGGAATNYDTLRVSVQLSEARADALDAKDNVSLTRKKLIQLLGLEEDNRVLAGDLPVPDSSRVQNLEFTGIPEDRTDIRALDMRADAADKTRAARNSWMIPSVSLAGQLIYYNELLDSASGSIVDNQRYEQAYNFGIFLTWNLFDGGVSYAQSRQAVYQQVQADSRARAAKLQVPYDFAYWKKRFVSNTDHYQARKQDVARSEESVRLAKEEERAGTRTSTETLDAELDLFRAKAGVVNAQVNAEEAQLRLELALGRRI
ncbi:MAG: TolC family protein [Oligoflexia bacterium]|nr:TolC family protein [Oligoflexia bacterium]